MEKISGILPATPRTRSADISSAPPARLGAPTLGRSTPLSQSAIDKVSLSPEFEAFRSQGNLPELAPKNEYKNMEETKKLKVIEDLNRKFFQSKNDAPTVLEKSNSEFVPAITEPTQANLEVLEEKS